MPRVTITVADRTPQPYRFPLDSGRLMIGRGEGNDMVVDCGSVSGKHAEMTRVPGGFELRDLGSTNGIKENGMRKSMIFLRDGSMVMLGDVAFEISFSFEEIEALSRETPLDPGPPRLPEIKKDAFKETAIDSHFSPPSPSRREKPVRSRRSDGGGWGLGTVLLFLILIAIAFCAGMAIRYQKETGRKWIEEIGKKPAASQAE